MMKFDFGKLKLATCLLCLPGLVFGLSIKTDRSDAIYPLGAKAAFEISADKPGQLSYILTDRDGVVTIGEGTVNISNRPVRVEGSLNHPGFLRCSVIFAPADGGKPIRKKAAAAFDPEKIQPAAGHRPADFGAFWAGKKRELSAISLKPVLREVSNDGKIGLYDVTVPCLGLPVKGYYARPKGGKKKSCPAILFFKGAGVTPAVKGTPVSYAKEGFIAFSINALGIENGKPDAYYAKLKQTTYKQYKYIGRDDPDASFFTGMFLRTFRALEFLKAQPEWDGKNLVVYGSSQGGAQALAAAGLDPDVSFVFAGVPAMCDHGGVVCGWPRMVPVDGNGQRDQKVLSASRYVDCVNFAENTTVPALFTVGFVDNTCRPESVYAAYNAYAGPKEIINEPEMGHAIPARHKAAAKQEIFKACGFAAEDLAE